MSTGTGWLEISANTVCDGIAVFVSYKLNCNALPNQRRALEIDWSTSLALFTRTEASPKLWPI